MLENRRSFADTQDDGMALRSMEMTRTTGHQRMTVTGSVAHDESSLRLATAKTTAHDEEPSHRYFSRGRPGRLSEERRVAASPSNAIPASPIAPAPIRPRRFCRRSSLSTSGLIDQALVVRTTTRRTSGDETEISTSDTVMPLAPLAGSWTGTDGSGRDWIARPITRSTYGATSAAAPATGDPSQRRNRPPAAGFSD